MRRISRRDFLKGTAAGTASLAAIGVLGACSGSSDTSTTTAAETEAAEAETAGETAEEAAEETGESNYRILYSGEISTLNYLITASTSDQGPGANVVDTLVEYDSFGELKPSLATEWTYDEDALTWTFTLREGQKWIDTNGDVVGDVTAQDFVDAMKYALTPSNQSMTVSNLYGVIANAREYYDGLAGEGDEIDFDEVGVKALDDTTLQYTLAGEVPYFLSMLTYVTFMPAYGPQLEELGTSFATSADTMYYSGAYYISDYEPQVKMVMTKNPYNWDADNVLIDNVQKTYNSESGTIGPEMAKRDEIDYTSLSADIVDAWMEDPETSGMVSMERPSIDYSYYYCFNFNVYALDDNYQRKGDGSYSIDAEYEPANWEIAVNNENFRQSIKAAINRVSTVYVDTGDYADPSTYIMNTITPTGFATDSETGMDYVDQPAFADIMAKDSYDKDAALEYKEAAMAELDGKVTFPVKVLIRYNPSTTNWEDQCIVLAQQIESVLGTDYIECEVVAGPSENFLGAVRRESDYMLLLCNWGADYADPETFTDPFYQEENSDGTYSYGGRYAYMAYAIIDKTESADTVAEYFSLVEAAKAITTDTDARYAAFAEAEAYLINHALVVPYGVSVADFVASKLNPWEGQYAPFGVSSLRYKGQKKYDHFISMEEYEASAAEHA